MPLQNKNIFTEEYLLNNHTIALLIPHFNNSDDLYKTLASIEFSGKIYVVIVDDGSENPPIKENLHSFISSDNTELEVLYLKENLGVQEALNKGISFIIENLKVQYIARIDVGDLLLSNRLDKQAIFLQNNPEIGIVGTSAKFVDEYGKMKFVTNYPENDDNIRKHMAMRCNLLHPTVMYRLSIFDDEVFYPAKYPHAEDYAFFVQKMKNTKVANIQEVLTQVNFSKKGISLSNRKMQLKSRIKIIYHNYFFSFRSLLGILYTASMLFIPHSFINSLKKRTI